MVNRLRREVQGCVHSDTPVVPVFPQLPYLSEGISPSPPQHKNCRVMKTKITHKITLLFLNNTHHINVNI